MKIVAESQPVISMPFVHLGYLAASHIKPNEGLLLSGGILAVLGIGIASSFLIRKKLGRIPMDTTIWKSRTGIAGIITLLLSIGCGWNAWTRGERHYPNGEAMTEHSMRWRLEDIERKRNNTPDDENAWRSNPIKALPTTMGEYELAVVFQNPEKKYLFIDGWETPMKLKVVVTEKKADYILMSAGADRKWNTPDDFTSQKYAERWEQ
jgi:hypothetical protein